MAGSSQETRGVWNSIDIWLQNASYGIIHHFLWKSLIVIFTIVLLFGRPCQLWFIPASGDVAMNVLYVVGFVIFVIDIIFHSYLDPKYLPFASCDRKGRKSGITSLGQRKYCFPYISLGSFNFWCDFLSTLCFLLEFNVLSRSRFGQKKIEIVFDQFGLPVSIACRVWVICDRHNFGTNVDAPSDSISYIFFLLVLVYNRKTLLPPLGMFYDHVDLHRWKSTKWRPCHIYVCDCV